MQHAVICLVMHDCGVINLCISPDTVQWDSSVCVTVVYLALFFCQWIFPASERLPLKMAIENSNVCSQVSLKFKI